MKIGSLFTGTGALDAVPLRLFGDQARVVWHSEISGPSIALLKHRDPGVPNLGDIALVDPSAVEPVDAVTFGWPCQPHSAAGKRLGSEDPRALWPHVHRLVAGLRPRYLFGENVARVASNGELRRVARSLAAVGYLGGWHCLRASDVGAPHRRDRLFLFAVRGDVAAAGTLGQLVRDEPRGGGRAGGEGAGVAGADGPQRTADLTLLPTPAARLGMSGNVTADVARERAARRRNGPNLDDAIALLPTPAVADSRGTRNATAGRTPENDRHHSGWTLSDVAYADRWGQYAAAVARWESVLGRPAPEPTMTSDVWRAMIAKRRAGRDRSPVGMRGSLAPRRVLAPAFVEWMMGLPAGWVTEVPGLTRSQQLALLGNGVVPQQAIAAFDLLVPQLLTPIMAATG